MLSEGQLVVRLRSSFDGQGYVTKQNVEQDATAPEFDINTAPESTGAGIDLVADCGTQRWVIEAKGDYDKTQPYYVNVPQGIAQIASRMKNRPGHVRFGFAVPYTRIETGETPNAKAALKTFQCSDMWVRLELWLILVRDDGTVLFKAPEEVCDFLSSLE